MTAEGTGGCEFAELVSDHIFSDVYGDMLLTVVNGNGVTDHFGKMVDALDQVLSTDFLPDSFIAITRSSSLSLTKGPFLIDLLMFQLLPSKDHLPSLRRTMYLSLMFLVFLVL